MLSDCSVAFNSGGSVRSLLDGATSTIKYNWLVIGPTGELTPSGSPVAVSSDRATWSIGVPFTVPLMRTAPRLPIHYQGELPDGMFQRETERGQGLPTAGGNLEGKDPGGLRCRGQTSAQDLCACAIHRRSGVTTGVNVVGLGRHECVESEPQGVSPS